MQVPADLFLYRCVSLQELYGHQHLTLQMCHLQELIGDCEDSLDTNSTDNPDADPPSKLGLAPPLAQAETQQRLLSIPFSAGALAAQGQHVTGMSSQPSSACSSDVPGASDADRLPSGGLPTGNARVDRAPISRDSIESAPFGKAPMGRALMGIAPIDRAPTDRAPVNRAQTAHLPRQTQEGIDGTRQEHRCAEQHSRAELVASTAESDDDQDSEASAVFDQPPASEAHTNVVQAMPLQLHRSADAQQAVTLAAHDDDQANTAPATAASAAATTENSHLHAASDTVQVADECTAARTRGPAVGGTKTKAKFKPRASAGQGVKEAVQKGGAGPGKPAVRTTGLPRGHSNSAAQLSALNTAHNASKAQRGRASQECHRSFGRRSAKAGRSGLLASAVAPLGVPIASVPSAAMDMPVAAALFPRLAVKQGTAVPPTAGVEPARATSAPAAAPSRPAIVSHTAAQASPGAAAASSRASHLSPRAAAQSPKSSATHWLTAKSPSLPPRIAAQSPKSSPAQRPEAKACSLSPRAAAATSRGSSSSPRAAVRPPARSPRSPISHSVMARGKPPFVSTTRSGIPEPASACPLPPKSPRSPRPADLSPKRMGTDPSAVAQSQPVNTSDQAVLADQSQPMLLLDTRSNAASAILHSNGMAEEDTYSSRGVQRGVPEGIQGSLESCQGVTKGSWQGHFKADPSNLNATSGTAGRLSEKPAENDYGSFKQQRKVFHSSAHHQPPQEASQPQLGSEASSCNLDATHSHRQLRRRVSSQPPQHESLLQLTVADQHSSGGISSSQSEDDGASSMSSMSDDPCGRSGMGSGVRKADTSAWNQFPQQPDSVGSIAQLFMMRMRARAVLQVCADCTADSQLHAG